ncbi:lipopolysaccharide biosynthesis protein [Massilia sp. YIM B04103]|uniref:lipopolysaccharide biosynthesis protein n=1 Tax=Massilia sp. YIM B04103 TaxID=2963106 RepID=UPI00210D085D|nr:lipopolysaccharide biosynthesis protein [Massilia sp. YIM B04103]
MASSDKLDQQAVGAVKWAALGTVARFSLQLAVQIVLARLLGPDSYGVFALGLLVLTLSTFLADFGFSWGLVQNQEVREEDVRFAFTWQFLSGSLAMAAMYFGADWIAAAFHEPRLGGVVRWLSLTCLLTALTAPGSNMLRRKLDFRWLNLIQIASYATGYLLVGLPLAFYGAGVWSLVAAWLVQAASALVYTWWRNPHPLRPLLWYSGAQRSTQMGATVFVTNLCNWCLNNLDRVFLGRLLHAHAVGVYTVAYNLANTPNSLFLTALQPAFLAAGARMQDEPARLRSAYLSILSAVGILIAPLFVLLASVADALIATLYGPRWDGAGTVLSILALSMPAYIAWGMSTPVLWNTGGKHLESLLQLPVLAAAAIGLYWCAGQGVALVALVAAATLVLRALVIGGAACRRIGVGAADLAPIAWRSAVMMLLAAGGAYAGTALAARAGAGSLGLLAAGGSAGLALLVLVVALAPRLLGLPVVDLLARFSPPLPRRVGTYLRAKCLVG